MNVNSYITNATLKPRSFIYSLTSNALVIESTQPDTRIHLFHAPVATIDTALTLSASNAMFSVLYGSNQLYRTYQDSSLGRPMVDTSGIVKAEFMYANPSKELRKGFVTYASRANWTANDHLFAGIGFSNETIAVYQVPSSNAVHAFFYGASTSNSIEMARIMTTSNGEVRMGVNTVEPKFTLDIGGDIRSSGTVHASSINTGTAPITIGTLTTSNLSVLGSAFMQNTPATASSNGPVLSVNMNSACNGPIALFTYNTSNTVLSITSAGVGIGTSNPQYALEVAKGNIYTNSNIIINTPSNVPPLTISSTALVSNLNVELLGGQPRSFYQNASNINTGTLPSNVLPLTGITAGTYGARDKIPLISFDVYGRGFYASNLDPAIPISGIVNLPKALLDASNASNIKEGTLPLSVFPVIANIAGNYGNPSNVAVFTLDNIGRVTAASNLAIRIPASAVIGLTDALIAGSNASNITQGTLPLSVFPVAGVTPGNYGSSSNALTVWVDPYGRVYAASNMPYKMSADAIVSGKFDSNLFPITGIKAGVYGGASNFIVVCFDNTGRALWASNEPFNIGNWSMTDVRRGTLATLYGGTGMASNTIRTNRLVVAAGPNSPMYTPNELVWDPNSGFIGINTSTPVRTMDVGGDFNFNGKMYWSNVPVVFGDRYYVNNYQWCNIVDGSLRSPANVIVDGNLYVKGSIIGYYDVSKFQLMPPQSQYYPDSNLFGPTGVNAGSYGNPSNVAVFTVDSTGRVFAASNLAMDISATAITRGTLPIPRGGTGLTGFQPQQLVYGAYDFKLSQTGNLVYDDINKFFGVNTAGYVMTEAVNVRGNILLSGSVISWSDRAFKRDIEDIPGALDIVRRLRGVRYTHVDDKPTPERPNPRSIGVVAQEVIDVLPEVVRHHANGLAVEYGNMVGVLIEAIKELAGRVDQLEAALAKKRA